MTTNNSTNNELQNLILSNDVIRQNYDKLVATLLSKGVNFRGRRNRQVYANITFAPNDLNVCRLFPGFGIFYGTVINYDFPFFKVKKLTADCYVFLIT
jgi:hypothetical protein